MNKDRTEICNIISKMLDAPDESGIYPTTIAYTELEKYIERVRMEARVDIYARMNDDKHEKPIAEQCKLEATDHKTNNLLINMTKEEFYKKYGEIKVKFSSYNKFIFAYSTMLDDGSILTCKYGGTSYNIYRHDVSIEYEEIIENLQPYCGSVYKNGVEICHFHDDIN